MARDINWDEPISDEDRAWLEQRPDMPAGMGMTNAQRLADNDAQHGKAAKDAKKSRAERINDLIGVMANAQNEIERLQREQAEEDNANVAVAGSPASGLVKDNTPVDGQRPQGAPTPEQDYSDEKYWTKQRLSTEISNRNEDRLRDSLPALSTTGTRAELVERLQRDDRELAEAQEELNAMAAEKSIRTLRELVAEPDDTNEWTDERLGRVLDGTATVNLAAAAVWKQKAAVFAHLVDTSESGSSRKLSDLRKNAMEMAGHFAAADPVPANPADGPIIQRMRRRV